MGEASFVLAFACVTFPMPRVFTDHCDLAPPSQAGRFYCPGSGVVLFTAKWCSVPLERLGQARRRAYGPPPGRRIGSLFQYRPLPLSSSGEYSSVNCVGTSCRG